MFAVLYDIHGNLPALEAVLSDARKAGATSFVLGGDYTLFGAWPQEVLDLLYTLEAKWVRGNGERWTHNPADAPQTELVQSAIAACAEKLSQGTVRELAALPESSVASEILFCHGSPISDVESFAPTRTYDDERLMGEAKESAVCFGHTHLQFQRRLADGTLLVNPGSVGMPFDTDRRAAYGLCDERGEISLQRVQYDYAKSAQAVRQYGGDWAQTVARRIEYARIDV
jgi:predicted phosphodiesterase